MALILRSISRIFHVRGLLALLCASACCLASFSPSWAQAAELRLRVVDQEDGRALVGANAALVDAGLGAHADEHGRCVITVPAVGRYDVLVSFVGYRSRLLRIAANGEEEVVVLERALVALADVVVSASRRAQSFAEAPISIAVVEADKLRQHNAPTLSEPLRYVAGVSQVGDQISIRGSSGYSRGTGSRVLLLLDGFPMLAADLGDIKWDAIPASEVERIEIIKGAGSALYGTGALGGVINVLTRAPAEEPRSEFHLHSGIYNSPAYASWEWTDQPMYWSGADFSHSRTQGKTGWSMAGGQQYSSGYYENGDYRRSHLYAKIRQRFSPASYAQVLANWAVDDHGVFLQWKDRSEPLRVPVSDRLAATLSKKLNLNGEYFHLLGPQLGLRVKSAYYRTAFENTAAAGGLRSTAHKLYAEMQADYSYSTDFKMTAGWVGASDRVVSPASFLGRRTVRSTALYGQGVYSVANSVELTAGMRYDWNQLAESSRGTGQGLCPSLGSVAARSQGQFSPQIGFSYRPRVGTALRASTGRGFRAPSVSEMFTQAQASGVLVCANPHLVAERSWSYEVGVRQALGSVAFFDGALFWNSYRDLIEARPDPNASGATPIARFVNLAEARVRGIEAVLRAALPYNVEGTLSYTYVDGSEELAASAALPPYCHGGYAPGGRAPLPFRARHALRTGLSGRRGKTQMGFDFLATSRFERVSGLFAECGRDQLPVYQLDFFVGRQWGKLHFNARLDNALQYHYALGERQLQPPRRFSLAVAGAL